MEKKEDKTDQDVLKPSYAPVAKKCKYSALSAWITPHVWQTFVYA